jgi:hypothetical protein
VDFPNPKLLSGGQQPRAYCRQWIHLFTFGLNDFLSRPVRIRSTASGHSPEDWSSPTTLALSFSFNKMRGFDSFRAVVLIDSHGLNFGSLLCWVFTFGPNLNCCFF